MQNTCGVEGKDKDIYFISINAWRWRKWGSSGKLGINEFA